MLLKPATPLSVLLLVAFVLLLLSVLSTPVVKSIPIAKVDDITFGVFGYCKGSSPCSGIRVGYSSDDLFDDPQRDSDFSLPSGVRHSLSPLLIVHPVAAFLTLVCFGLAAAAHLHSPSHSPRYLLGLLILLLPTLLVTLLAFLVDILLFVPHLLWGGWIVLAATIILTTSGVVTCAMRRTLVSRKARKRRIAENAEMSGENFYNRQNAQKVDAPTVISEPKEPALNKMTTPDSLPAFATFETANRSPDDDSRPLNSASPPLPDTGRGYDRPDQFGPPSRPPPRDEYGNPIRPVNGLGPMRNPSDPRLRNQYSNGSMGSQRGGFYGPRGRAGHSMRGRGGPRGPPHGYGMGGRGAPMGPGMRGRGRGPPPVYPPVGYSPYGPGPGPGPGPGNGYGPPGVMAGGPRHGSPRIENAMRGPSPIARAADVSPAGQAIEMQDSPGGVNRRESRDLVLPLGLQQTRQASPAEVSSPTSMYSRQDSFVPARAGWNNPMGQEPTLPNLDRHSPAPLRGSPVPTGPGELRNASRSPVVTRDNYYEDVEPQFAEPTQAGPGNHVPSALTPGAPGEPEPRTSFDDLPEGARSPTTSETSHFTSISQRGVNPQWRPPESERWRAKQQQQDLLLGSNPDFQLPPSTRGRGGSVSRGRVPVVPAMPPMPSLPSLNNAGGDSRYPAPR